MINWAQHTVPQIKAELKLRGLKLSGKKAELVTRLTKVIESEEFKKFPQLPPEVRQKIWGFALPGRRVIELSLCGLGQNSLSTSTPCLSGALHIMLSCKEGLNVVARRYRPNEVPYNPSRHSNNNTSGWPVIYLEPNFHDDVFHISDIQDSIHALDVKTLANIKTVAFYTDDFETCFDAYEFDVLMKLTALKTIILIEDYRPPPKEGSRPRSFATQFFDMFHPPALEPPNFLKTYNATFTCEQSHDLKEQFSFLVATYPKFKKFENVDILFTQLH